MFLPVRFPPIAGEAVSSEEGVAAGSGSGSGDAAIAVSEGAATCSSAASLIKVV